MNDPLVNIRVIFENDGTISHCLGCKAGLAESCSDIASVLFYLEATTTRIHGKLGCTQVKWSWSLPTYFNEVPYARAKDIVFSSAKKLKEKLDKKIDNLQQPQASSQLLESTLATSSSGIGSAGASAPQHMQRALAPSNEKRENLNIEGFQRPTLGPVCNFDIVSGEFVQILHTGNSHWVCVSSIGCPPGHVKLYDRFSSDAISQEIELQINDLLGGRLLYKVL